MIDQLDEIEEQEQNKKQNSFIDYDVIHEEQINVTVIDDFSDQMSNRENAQIMVGNLDSYVK